MFPITANFARIPSLALKLGMFLVLAVFAWTGLSIEVAPNHSDAGGAVAIHSQVGVDIAHAIKDTDPNGQTNDHAAAKWTANAQDPKTASSIETGILAFINSIIDFLYIVFNPFLFLAGWLMTPDWVFGEVFGLRPVLHQFWVLISNIVYVIFAFLLVGIAFMNIFGSEQSAWQIKTKLPKLIIGVIAVPFTWFFVSAITSVASILTASVIQLPAGMLSDVGANHITFTPPAKCTLDFTKKLSEQSNDKKGLFGCEAGTKPKTLGELFNSEGAYGVLTAYAYGIFKFQDMKIVDGGVIKTAKTIADLSVSLVASLIFFVVFLLLLVALVFAMVSRWIMLWIYAIFSPLLSLSYFFEWKLPDGLGEKFWISKIISLAMVPVFVAGALSFGMLFLSLANQNMSLEGKSDFVKPTPCAWENCQSFTFAGTTYETTGIPAGFAETTNKIGSSGFGVFGKMMIEILGLIVLWMAVMAALKSNEITKNAVEPIAEFGKAIGGIMKNLPKSIPIIPTGGGKWMGTQGLASMGTTMQNTINSMAVGEGSKLGETFGQAVGKKLGLSVNQVVKAVNDLERAMDQHKPHTLTDPTQKAEALKKVLGSTGLDAEVALRDPSLKPKVIEAIRKTYDLKDEDMKWLKNATTVKDFDTAFKTLAEHNRAKGMETFLDGIDGHGGKGEGDKISNLFKADKSGEHGGGSSGPSSAPAAPKPVITPTASSDWKVTEIKIEIEGKWTHTLKLAEDGSISKATLDWVARATETWIDDLKQAIKQKLGENNVKFQDK